MVGECNCSEQETMQVLNCCENAYKKAATQILELQDAPLKTRRSGPVAQSSIRRFFGVAFKGCRAKQTVRDTIPRWSPSQSFGVLNTCYLSLGTRWYADCIHALLCGLSLGLYAFCAVQEIVHSKLCVFLDSSHGYSQIFDWPSKRMEHSHSFMRVSGLVLDPVLEDGLCITVDPRKCTETYATVLRYVIFPCSLDGRAEHFT
jgi:hypothetical protein